MAPDSLRPPSINPTIPPGVVPGERRVSWKSLLDRPTTLAEAGIDSADVTLTGPLTLHSLGVAPLTLTRDEGAASLLLVLEVIRDTTVIGYLGMDASDHLVIVGADGSTVLATIDATGVLTLLLKAMAPHLEATTDIKTPKVLDGSGAQVVGARGAAVTDASTSAASGSSASGSAIGHASADPVPKADYDALVDRVNAIQTANNNNASAITSAVGTLNAAIGQLNAWLARARAATGHGLIA